jgi:methionine-gamma-lyase
MGIRRLKGVIYPTLFNDPEQVALYKAQCDFPGGMFSIVLKGGKAAAFDFLRHITIGRNAVSLGGVETLACHPNSTTHSGFTQEELAATGMSEGLVRISVGIEDWRDLLADFEQALERCREVRAQVIWPDI